MHHRNEEDDPWRRVANQKLKLLCLCQILLPAHRRGPSHHRRPADRGAGPAWDIKAERKSVYDDLEALRQLGLDVQSRKGRSPGWFVGQRDFELPELKLLVDAVQSSRFITQKKSDALIRKLEGLASSPPGPPAPAAGVCQRPDQGHEREHLLQRGQAPHRHLPGQRASPSATLTTTCTGRRCSAGRGRRYAVSPYGLIWNSENYYLVAYDHRQPGDAPLPGGQDGGDCGDRPAPAGPEDSYPDFDAGRLWPEALRHVFRPGGARLPCAAAATWRGWCWDRFGQDVILVPDGRGALHRHRCLWCVSPQFFGWLFGLEDNVELIAPQKAAEEYRRKLKAVLEQYG